MGDTKTRVFQNIYVQPRAKWGILSCLKSKRTDICAGGFIGTPALRKSSEGSEDSRSDSEARRDVASRAEAKMHEVEQRKLYCASSASDADGYRSA